MCRAGRIGVIVGVVALLAAADGARAQSAPEPLGRAPWAHMHMLLQKTVFKVDVLTVDICFDAPTAARLGALAAHGPLSGARADSVVRAALEGQRAFARIEFVRDVTLDQFLDGVDDDLRNARKAGLLADSVYRAIAAGVPEWYGFARADGIRKGDQILYQLDPQSVRTRFVRRDGSTPLDDVSTGRARRNSPLASWLAPGSDFRGKLLQSLSASNRGAVAARCAVP